MKPILLSVVMLLSPVPLLANQVRVYCKPDGVVFEKRADNAPFTDQDKLFDVPAFLMEESEIPAHTFAEQLRCEGTSLVVDTSIVTPRILQERALSRARSEYDTELARATPDVVRLMRLARDIELIRQGDEGKIGEYQP